MALAVLGFCMQLRTSLLTPASEALLRTIVDKRQVAGAVAANQGRDAAVAIVAGPLGGVLYAVGQAVPFAVQGLGWVVLLLTNARLRGQHRPVREAPTRPGRDLADGLRFVGRSRLLRDVSGTAMLINLAAAGLMSTLIMSLQLAGRPPELIGLVSLVVGLGGLLRLGHRHPGQRPHRPR